MAYSYKITKEMHKILPEHYIKRCVDFMTHDPLPVHWEKEPGDHKLNEWNQIKRVQNVPIKVMYPRKVNEGLWGGEGIVQGFRIKGLRKRRVCALWMPQLWRRIVYSEILDQCLSLTVTPRVMMLIDDHYGLDYYILKTHERDLNSQLGMAIKRRMLVALATKSLYPNDTTQRDRVYNKYKEFVITEDEAEWVGLPLEEAVGKGQDLYDRLNRVVPLKESLAQQFIQHLKEKKLKEQQESSARSWKSILNPFEEKTKQP